MRIAALGLVVLVGVSGAVACGGSDAEAPPGAGPGADAGSEGSDGGGATAPAPTSTTTSPPPVDAASYPARLTLDGRAFRFGGKEIKLRGGNFDGVAPGKTPAEKAAVAADFTNVLHLNFARYRVSFDNVDRPSCLSEQEEAYLDDLHYLTDAGVWVLLEMRAEDAWSSGSPDLYVPGTAVNTHFKCAWTYAANKVKGLPFVAGFGLLAEPSTNKSFPPSESADKLRAFQGDLMKHLAEQVGDTWTPFFLGTDYNYDTLQFRKDASHDGDLYFTAIPAAYRTRVAYEVNFLMPKPWINEGTGPGPDLEKNDLGAPLAFPQPNPVGSAPFDFFVTPNAGGFSGESGWDPERVFSHHREDPAKFPMLLSKAFIPWNMGTAVGFAERNKVPMVVDQFGAARESNVTGQIVEGQVAFERALVEWFEQNHLGWSRWGYNAGDRTRKMDDPAKNTEIRAFYAQLAP